VQGSVSTGLGAFAGLDIQYGVGVNKAPTCPGASDTVFAEANANAGVGASKGVSLSVNPGGAGGSAGRRLGVAVGIQASAGLGVALNGLSARHSLNAVVLNGSFMNVRCVKRAAACLAVVLAAVGLNINASAAESLFCAITGGIGAAAFLLIRPSVSLLDRLHAIGLWDFAILATLAVYVLFMSRRIQGVTSAT